MNLSSTDIARISAEVESVVRTLHAAHLSRGEGTLQRFLGFFQDDVIAVGTGSDEVVYSKEEMTSFLEREWTETPRMLHHVLHSVEVRVLSAEIASAQSFVDIYLGESDGNSFHARFSTVFRMVDGEWRCTHLHGSTPWEIQPEGVSWPTDELKARALKLEQAVAARTEELSWANRELAVEAALERIRRVTVAMQSPDDLIQVITQLRVEVDQLWGEDVAEVLITLDYDDDHVKAWWILDIADVPDSLEESGVLFPRNPDPPHPTIERILCQTAPFSKDYISREELQADITCLEHYFPDETEMTRPLFESGHITELWFTSTTIHNGWIALGWVKEPLDEIAFVQRRMAGVVDETLRRVDELRTAQRMAREAEISLAVEKVRARATAMHRSEELADVALSLRNELQNLGISGVSSSTVYTAEGDGAYRIWDMAEIQGVDESQVHLDFVFRPEDAPGEFYFNDILAADGYSSFLYEGERLRNIASWLNDHDPASAETMVRLLDDGDLPALWISSHPVERGFLSVDTVEPPPDELGMILPRMAAAFDLAYRRFEDLKKAEQQAREARIEAALERVRSEAMAMQGPDDIGHATHRMFEEIRVLCADVRRLGLGIVTSADTVQPWLVGKDDEGKSRIFRGNTITEGERPEIDAVFAAWRQGKHYWFRESMDFLEWAPNVYKDVGTSNVIRPDAGHEQYFCAFAHKTGFLYLITNEPRNENSETGSIAIRFGAVFDLAYQRYRDLTKAEEDYRALLEEKARTEKALSDLQATQQQLIQSEKLASLGSLTAGIAHEIKNPLNFVNNFADVSLELVDELAEALVPSDTGAGSREGAARAENDRVEVRSLMADLRANAEQIAKHGRRADDIVKSMMQHARGGEAARETVDVNAFVSEYVDLAWHGMRAKDHTFDCDVTRVLAPDVGSASLQPQDMGRALLNLLGNAFYATRMDEASKKAVVRVETGLSEDKLNVTIKITDSGPGIPDHIRTKIFEPFFTTKPTGEGTGLGLSLSHDIVTKGHGGTLSAGNVPGGGAVFTIILPSIHPTPCISGS